MNFKLSLNFVDRAESRFSLEPLTAASRTIQHKVSFNFAFLPPVPTRLRIVHASNKRKLPSTTKAGSRHDPIADALGYVIRCDFARFDASTTKLCIP